ncbi:MAG: hypothetical protein GC189_04515 [Alphaproteobacteria bacterium]|nr:hypothetical protein [Alphaproteobacteria bacterium]
MARQKTIRLRALPDQPGQAPSGGAAAIDVPFIDLTPSPRRSAPPKRRAKAQSRRKAKKRGGVLKFVLLSAFSAGFVVLAAMAIVSGMAQSAPV